MHYPPLVRIGTIVPAPKKISTPDTTKATSRTKTKKEFFCTLFIKLTQNYGE